MLKKILIGLSLAFAINVSHAADNRYCDLIADVTYSAFDARQRGMTSDEFLKLGGTEEPSVFIKNVILGAWNYPLEDSFEKIQYGARKFSRENFLYCHQNL